MPQPRRALVTGVTGQDGSYLAEQLLDEGWHVTGLVRDAEEPVVAGVQVEVGDLSDPDLFGDLLDRARPDVVFHLAGLSSVAQSWEQPALAADVTGAAVARLLGAAAAMEQPPRVVLACSAEVFGGGRTSPQDERTTVLPASPYGAAKAYAWHLARVYRAAGLFVSVALLYNHESPRRPGTFVTRKITRGAVEVATGAREQLALGNLEAVRDWGWAPDYVRAMRLMAAAEVADDFVVATGQGRTVRELVATAFAAAGVPDWERHVVVDPRFYRPVDSVALVGDAGRARELLGWEPSVTFEDIVEAMVRADEAEVDAVDTT